jgi:Uracil DNA glycosylase superfamily
MRSEEFMDLRRKELGSDSPVLDKLERLLDLYASKDLLPDRADAPLFDVCEHRTTCWTSNERKPSERAGISIPWIGKHYLEARICVIAINLSGWGGLNGQWEVCKWHIASQVNGGLGMNGEWFAYRAMAYVSVIYDTLTHRSSPDWEEPDRRRLAKLWDECALLEAVKCSPRGDRSNPSLAMFQACPQFLLLQEIDILKPDVVLLLGRTNNRDAVRPILDPRWGSHPGSIERDIFALKDGSTAALFSLNHPSARNPDSWRKSLRQLHESVERCPLRM